MIRNDFPKSKGDPRKKAGFVIYAVLLALLSGCSGNHYLRSADKEVYGIISKKEKGILGKETNFTIESKKPPEEKPEGEAKTISLKDALLIAANYNRDYQYQKEDLYLRALSLTYQRHLFRPRLNVGGSAVWEKQGDEEMFSAGTGISLFQWLAHGAEISLDIATDFLRNLTGDPDEALGSVLSLNVLQPLFRGAGRRVVQENLTQAERDVIYQIRSFLRYQRSFSVDIAQRYYQLQEQKSILLNEESNYQRLLRNRERAEALGEAGRLPLLQVDQARQEELRAYDRMVLAEKLYQEDFDRFKVEMGLPPNANVEINDDEVRQLLEKELAAPKTDTSKTLETALEKRNDLLNALDAVADAERKALVAKNNLRGVLNLSVSTDVSTDADKRSFENFRFDEGAYTGGIDFELPTNRLSERNAYRQSLISLKRSRRNYSLLKDNVSLQVRASWRALEQARQSYRNQKMSFDLAERRVESTNILLEAGRASQRDILDAQGALLQTQNGLVGAAVDYLLAYLRLLRDTETLELNEAGVWNGEFL